MRLFILHHRCYMLCWSVLTMRSAIQKSNSYSIPQFTPSMLPPNYDNGRWIEINQPFLQYLKSNPLFCSLNKDYESTLCHQGFINLPKRYIQQLASPFVQKIVCCIMCYTVRGGRYNFETIVRKLPNGVHTGRSTEQNTHLFLQLDMYCIQKSRLYGCNQSISQHEHFIIPNQVFQYYVIVF